MILASQSETPNIYCISAHMFDIHHIEGKLAYIDSKSKTEYENHLGRLGFKAIICRIFLHVLEGRNLESLLDYGVVSLI